MTVIGYERSDFVAKETGAEVKGVQLYLARAIVPDKGKGNAVDRVYLTDAKLAANHFDPAGAIGKNVALYYNRWGKVERISLEA